MRKGAPYALREVCVKSAKSVKSVFVAAMVTTTNRRSRDLAGMDRQQGRELSKIGSREP
jgi:hypothetical protein